MRTKSMEFSQVIFSLTPQVASSIPPKYRP